MTLERIEHKVFASEAPLDEMGQFGSALTTTKLNTKDVAEIQALPAYTKGWGSAIISENNYPAMEEMNGVLNVMSYHTGYLYQEGIPTYSANQTYSATSWVKDLAGEKIYKSLQNENVGHSLTDTSWWQEVFGNSVYVKKSGDIMTGTLSIKPTNYVGALHLYNSNLDYTNNEAPATNNTFGILQFRDKNGQWAGYIQTDERTDGIRRIIQTVRRNIDGTQATASLGLQIDQQGNESLYTTKGIRREFTDFPFPSTKYTTFTVGDTGSTLTAPANGYFYFQGKTASTSSSWIYLGAGLATQCCGDGISGLNLHVYLPVRKGMSIYYAYDKIDKTNAFIRFYYAQGDQG